MFNMENLQAVFVSFSIPFTHALSVILKHFITVASYCCTCVNLSIAVIYTLLTCSWEIFLLIIFVCCSLFSRHMQSIIALGFFPFLSVLDKIINEKNMQKFYTL